MPKLFKTQTIFSLLLLCSLLSVLYCRNACAAQLPAQEVVVIIDCSESASPFLPAFGGILSRFISGARFGDSFTCYQFSSNPVLFARRTIEAHGDVHQLQTQFTRLRASGDYTNFTPALQRGLSEIKAALTSRPASDKFLILITDGRRFAGDIRSESSALEQLEKSFRDLKTGRDFHFYCFYLDGPIEPDLRSYLLTVGAYVTPWPRETDALEKISLADIRVLERARHLGKFPDSSTHSTFSLNFYPRRAPKELAMVELLVEAEFTENTLDRFFNVRPRRIVCQKEPWTETFSVETRGFTRGAYTGTFVLLPSEPQEQLVYPRNVSFSFSIAETLRVNIPEPLKFGPTGLRGDYEQEKTVRIRPSGADFPDSLDELSVVADMEIPDGIQLDVSPVLRDREIITEIRVSRSLPLDNQLTGTYKGSIRLVSPGNWAFAVSEIPMSIEVQKRGLNIRAVLRYVGMVAAAALIILAASLAFKDVRNAIFDYFAHRERPVGKLVPTRDPTRGLAKSINLAFLSQRNRTKDILAGAGDNVHVELPHISMIDKVYRLSGIKSREGSSTVVEVVKGGGQIIVNNSPHSGRVQLRHLDMVKFGDFEFRYEVPKPFLQVVLYHLSGEVQQGWLVSWNTDAEGFRYRPRNEASENKLTYARFYELKAVAFVRDFEGELTKNLRAVKAPRGGHLVRLVFADEEEITGYLFDWRMPADKFYFFPDSMGDNVLFFLIEKHTLKDAILIKENERQARSAKEKFRPIIEKLRREIGD